MELILIIIAFIVLWIIVKPYWLHYDNLIAFTGGLGSGKSFMSVQTAIVLLRKQRFKRALKNVKVFASNLLRKARRNSPLPYHPKPLLYCNIPVSITRKEMAVRLTPEYLLLEKKVVEGSVCLLDEVDSFANQFAYNNPCIVDNKGIGGDDVGNFDEFCRFYRHYTKGGFLIFNTQATANENLTIRRRQNMTNILFHFRKWGIPLIAPNILYTVKCQNVVMSDDVRTIESGNAEDNMKTLFGFMPWRRRYDTYCYSERYSTVPEGDPRYFKRLKTNECLVTPVGKRKKLTTSNDDIFEKKSEEPLDKVEKM